MFMKSPLWKSIFKPIPVNPDSIEDSENLRKQAMLQALSLLGIVFLAAMSVRLSSEKSYFFAFLNLGFAFFSAVFFFFLSEREKT